MGIQFSVAVRNARLNSIQTTIGTTAHLKIMAGSLPANAAAADTGTVLANISLPDPYLAQAANGAVALTGSWTASTTGAGTATYWRIYAADGTTCHIQGSAGMAASGADMILDNTNIAVGQTITVGTFNLTSGNA